MKGYCCVPKCKNTVNRGYLIPKDETMKRKWLEAMRRSDWSPGKHCKICLKHLKKKDLYESTMSGHQTQRILLRKDAIPSIFTWNKKEKKRKKKKFSKAITKNQEVIEDVSMCKEDVITPEVCKLKCNDDESRNFLFESEDVEKNTDEVIERMSVEESIGISDLIDINDYNKESDECNLLLDTHGIILDMDNSLSDKDEIIMEESSLTNSDDDKQAENACANQYKMSAQQFKNNDKAIHFYTGLESFAKFMFVYRTLGKAVDSLKYIYATKTNLSSLDQFFLTLIILRLNKTHYELSILFGITIKQISNIFITWIRFMKLQWAEISQWPSRELVNFFTPTDFRKKFYGTRGILDGTEIHILKPGVPLAQQSTFSTYKNKPTVKTIVCATPGGLVSYVSVAYGGSTSDRQIMERCDFIQKCDPGDKLMADKGFDIQDLLAPYGIFLNIPAFFKKSNQISAKTVMSDNKIASKRVHIERIIGLGKTYKILTGPLNAIETLLADEILSVCFMLCNFRRPIIDENA